MGMVHRDLKLENILVDSDENIVISDFGFASVYRSASDMLYTACGSPCYAAPEIVLDHIVQYYTVAPSHSMRVGIQWTTGRCLELWNYHVFDVVWPPAIRK